MTWAFFLGVSAPHDPVRSRTFHDPKGVTFEVTVHSAVSTSKSYSMARHPIPSDKTVRSIKIGDERKRLSDGEGLYLLLRRLPVEAI
jgi:hypothetical protein